MSEEKQTQRPWGVPEETLEHLKAAGEATRKSFESLLPPGFIENRREARRQLLLAARSLIDAALKRTERRD